MVPFVLGTFVTLMVGGMPIAFAFGISVLATIIMGLPLPLSSMVQQVQSALDKWVWLSMPLFLMLGYSMTAAGITEKLINVSNAWVGRIPGSISHVSVITNTLMAGMSGSLLADAAAVGSALISGMKKIGYPAGYCSAIIATGCLIGPLIPPSLPAIIVGEIGQISILRLWFAGAIPGVILSVALLVTGYFVSVRKGFPRGEVTPVKYKVSTTLTALPLLVVPVIILGGMRLGIFTATEASASGVFIVLLFGLIYRKLTWKGLNDALLGSAKVSGLILLMIGFAGIFIWLVGYLKIGPVVTEFLTSNIRSPLAYVMMTSALVLFLGLFMDGPPIYLIFFPLLLPGALKLGIDPVYYGIVYIYWVMYGQLTPPVGPAMFVTNAIAECSVEEYLKEGWPLMASTFLVGVILVLVPQLALWLPNLILGPG